MTFRAIGAIRDAERSIEPGVPADTADQANWPAQMKEQAAPFSDRRVWAFIGKAQAARR